MGIPVVIAENGQGFPVKPVEDNAPVMTVAENGLGAPIVISELGAPFIVEGIAPPIDWNWQTFSMTNGGDGFQWVGYSVGGATLPNPAFGSISNEPTDKATLLAFYQDTASGVVLAVFSGEWEAELAGLEVSLGGLVLEPFEIEIIGGNTWLRYDGMPGIWAEGVVYEVLFGWDLVQAPFAITEAILGSGGLDYSLYDSGLASSLFQDAAGTVPALLSNPVGRWNARQKPPHYASQATSGQRPTLQSDGIKFDGSDDNLLMDWFTSSGNQTWVVDCVVPVTLSGTTAVIGNSSLSGEFAYLGFDGTTGQIRRGWGTANTTVGGPDFRGQRVIIVLTIRAGSIYTFANGTLIHSSAVTGAPNLTRSVRLGAASSADGNATLLFSGSIKAAALSRNGVTGLEATQITNEWLAAA